MSWDEEGMGSGRSVMGQWVDQVNQLIRYEDGLIREVVRTRAS